MGHVIAGAGLGRGLALHGADVLNVWRPSELEVETMYLTSNVGMRSTYLDIDHNQEHRSRFDALLQGADIFFINKRYGFMEKYGLTPNDLAQKDLVSFMHRLIYTGIRDLGRTVTALIKLPAV